MFFWLVLVWLYAIGVDLAGTKLRKRVGRLERRLAHQRGAALLLARRTS